MVTFGCKANQYGTQLLREALGRRGMEEVTKDADLVAVNTCTVTADAGKKARKLIRRINRENPYLAACERIRSRLDRPPFTADVLVGFPGETDAEFEETLALAGEVGFAPACVSLLAPEPSP
jgi:tRNA A37 methylthiotransferase MiaB